MLPLGMCLLPCIPLESPVESVSLGMSLKGFEINSEVKSIFYGMCDEVEYFVYQLYMKVFASGFF